VHGRIVAPRARVCPSSTGAWWGVMGPWLRTPHRGGRGAD
jgi:hypothetical protein